MSMQGVGPVISANLLIMAGDNPDGLRSCASFAALCGAAPIPVSSGRTDRHRPSRGGDRHANAALHHVVKEPHLTSRKSFSIIPRARRRACLLGKGKS